MVIVLGIESTAHTFGVGIVKDGKVVANVKDGYTTETGGIIPTESAKHHVRVKDKVLEDALEEAKIKFEDVDAISFSQGPGLAPCLLEGMKFAKELSKKYNKPLVPVNHCIAHLEIGTQGCTPKDFKEKSLQRAKLTKAKDPVMLYASGANTQIIAYASGKYRIFGETLDLGVGNFIDTFARYAGIGFPGGPKIEELAKESAPRAYPEKSSMKISTKGNTYIELPYKVKGMDIALSGIQTNLKQKLDKGMAIEDLAYSLQETVFAMLVETAERALAHTGKTELLLGGGVACNSRLQEMCQIMCEERGAKFFCPERPLLVDNGAMIAYLGEIMFNEDLTEKAEDIDIKPRQRTDEVEISWK
jgi:N6-L-threonylcarbamoyladenine synthase